MNWIKWAGTIVLVGGILLGEIQAQTLGSGQSFEGKSLVSLLDEVESLGYTVYYYEPWIQNIEVIQANGQRDVVEILEATTKDADLKFVFTESQQLYLWKGSPIRLSLGNPAPLLRPTSSANSTDRAQELIRLANQLPSPVNGPRIEEEVTIGTGQTTGSVVLSGRVRDLQTGTPIASATVSIPALKIGAYTDGDGYFSLTVPVGKHEMSIRSVGMSEVVQPVDLQGNGTIEVEMQEAIRELDEVVIEAEARSNIDGAQMGVSTVGIQAMKKMPALLGEVDIIKTAVMLPGVQTVGEGSAGFNVRGGGVDQNLVLLNHAPIFNPSHLFGFFSAFHPDMISDFQLYKSGVPARFGGRISSVFDVGMKEGNRKNYEFQAGISPITARATLEGPIANGKGSFIIGGRSTYSDWILRRLPDVTFQNSRAGFYDGTAHLSYEVNQNNQIDVSAYYSSDRFTLNRDTTFGYTNRSASASWKHFFTPKLYSVFTGVYSQYDYAIGSTSTPETSYELNYQIRHQEGKADFTWLKYADHYIRFGTNAIWYNLSPGNFVPVGEASLVTEQRLQQEKALEAAIYLSDEWRLTERLLIYGGLRFSSFTAFGERDVYQYGEGRSKNVNSIVDTISYAAGEIVQQYGGPEFRFGLRYSLDEASSVKVSYNRMRQYLHRISNTVSISPTDTWKLSDQYIRPQVGDQFALGYFRNFKQNSIETSMEVYYKPIQNLIDYKGGADLIMNPQLETELVNAVGRAYGVELLLRKNTGKLTGWVGYTYSRTLVQIAGEFREEVVNDGRWFPANFDKPHDVTVVMNYKVTRRLSFSGNMTYSTGRPITYPVAQYRYGNSNRVYYSDRNAFRIPDYFRVDLGMNVEGSHRVKKLAHSSWSFSVYNLFGRRNPYSIYFIAEDGEIQGYQLSIFGRPFGTITYQFRI